MSSAVPHTPAGRRRPVIAILLVGLCAATSATGARAATPLHERIDELIAAKAGGTVAPPAADAEFLRRVYLDLAGTIPTAGEARQFLSDASPDKRARLIDRLLDGPDYARRMADAFDVVLMERRTGTDANAAAWQAYLRASFAANKPWDRLAREILNPDADDPDTRAAALFYTRRLEKVGQNPTDYPGLTRDIGRLFLGVDVKCAQCHNHIYIKDYKQRDFQGLFAFVGQTFIRTDVKYAAIGEKPLAAKVEYVSVFKPGEKAQTGPRLPFAAADVDVPTFAKGQEWDRPPDAKKNSPGVPKFRTLSLLAEQAARADNDPFKRNIANRLWFLMMGRGLVHPLDLAHKANPPSHPELLTLLADELAAGGFDIKAFLREMALSQTYQRSGVLPDGGADVPPESYRVAGLKRVSAEQLARAMLTATGELQSVEAVAETKPAAPPPADAADANADAQGGPKPPAGPVPMREVHKRFAAAFASPAAEPEVEFAPSVAGALFVSNERLILDWLKPRPGNLVGRLSKAEDPAAVADELYLSVLTRPPTDEERAEVKAYLEKRPDRREAALGELAWALLASTEFCVNH